MLQKALFFIVFFSSGLLVQAQGLQSFNYYLSHPQVSQDAKDYYAGQFNINTSERVYSVLDSAFTQNSITRPFYIYLISKMIPEAENSLLAEINIICKYLTEKHPADLVSVLFADKQVDDKYKSLWAARLSIEIRIACNYDLLSCFKESRNTALENFHSTGKNRLEILYNMVRKDMNLFQQH